MKKCFDLEFLSRYRSALMGLAIFWIFFYHTGVSVPGLHSIVASGWMGVDIFFLVSGFGCCASLTKNPDVPAFYKRRAVRILPTWLAILLIMHLIGLQIGAHCPHTFWEGIQWYTGLGWWLGGLYYEWYIPTLLLFYVFAPLLFRMSGRQLLVGMGVAVLAGLLFHRFGLFEHLYMSYQRIPVMMLGFWAFKEFSKESQFRVIPACIMSVAGIALFLWGFSLKHGDLILSLGVRRYACLLFLIPLLKAISAVIGKAKFLAVPLVFLGGISMEIYLLHINKDYSSVVTDFLHSVLPASLVSVVWFIIVVAISWLLHLAVKKLTALPSRPR